MERQANYVLVGIIGVLLLIAAFISVVWLAHFQFNQQYDQYRINFRGPVSGLGNGAEVQFNGIKVGQITHIALDKADANLVITDVDLQAGTPVRVDSVAQAVSQGITGVKFIQISAGTQIVPLLRKASHDHPPVITSRRSGMEDLVNDATKITARGADALARVNDLLSPANISSVSATLADVQETTAELKARKTMFAHMDHALANLDRASADLQLTMAAARGTLGSKDKGALSDVAQAAAELHGAAADMRGLMKGPNGPVSELSNTTLPQATEALDSVQRAAARFDSLANQLQQNPGAVLNSKPAKEVELPR